MKKNSGVQKLENDVTVKSKPQYPFSLWEIRAPMASSCNAIETLDWVRSPPLNEIPLVPRSDLRKPESAAPSQEKVDPANALNYEYRK